MKNRQIKAKENDYQFIQKEQDFRKIHQNAYGQINVRSFQQNLKMLIGHYSSQQQQSLAK